jgi:shikimate dehydrogenase
MEPLRLGLVGYPLGHSRSPAIHNAALWAMGLAGEYRLYPVPPFPAGIDELQGLVNRLRNGELHGLNLTIPHKQSILPFLDELTPSAQAIGAVNTILPKNGFLQGENTDTRGFLADLHLLAPEALPAAGESRLVAGKPASFAHAPAALVLGAGGSARAVVYGLASAGFQVIVAARRMEQADKIARSHENVFAIPFDSASLASLVANPPAPITLLVNTTPIGMQPHAGACPWPESQPFPEGAVVYDLVYNPAETLLAQRARQAGLCAFTGLGMLVEQAALAFELWTGLPAPREIMRQAAEQV